MNAEQIAAGLLGDQRTAMLGEHWTSRVDKGLVRLGLVYWATGRHGKKLLKFRPLGLKVRALLENQP